MGESGEVRVCWKAVCSAHRSGACAKAVTVVRWGGIKSPLGQCDIAIPAVLEVVTSVGF